MKNSVHIHNFLTIIIASFDSKFGNFIANIPKFAVNRFFMPSDQNIFVIKNRYYITDSKTDFLKILPKKDHKDTFSMLFRAIQK